MHFNDRFIHRSDGIAGRGKNKLLQSVGPTAAALCAPLFRLAERLQIILHVPRDQQLSDLQPLAK